MKLLIVTTLLFMLLSSTQQQYQNIASFYKTYMQQKNEAYKQQPNENCYWRAYHQCPIESAGSSPVCDNTSPIEVSPGIYGMKICAAETPKAIGGNFEIGIAIFGTILTVDVIPTQENNVNCSDGAGSVGLRVFSAHCEVKGPGKIRGYWAITYKMPTLQTPTLQTPTEADNNQ